MIMFLWILYSLILKKDVWEICNKFPSIFTITIFSMQPSIINYLLNIISCTEIDENKFYISTFLNEECYTSQHNKWVYKLFIPSFLFYGCLLPIAAFSYMKFNENSLHERKHVTKIGFLSSGYCGRINSVDFCISS